MLTGIAVLALCATIVLVLALRGEGRVTRGATGSPRDLGRPLVPAPQPRAAATVVAMSAREDPEPEPVAQPSAAAQRERARLEEWRRDQLEALGLDAALADRALEAGVAVSEVRSLVEHGCPPELAVEILV